MSAPEDFLRQDPKRSEGSGNRDPGGSRESASLGGGPTLEPGASAPGAAKSGAEPGRFGPYVLVRKLGEGGMGQVWLAEQTAPVHRQVALKLIRGGAYDSTVVERFESERQAIAIMNHPAIAKVYDAGTTADGQPYFAMEYVLGMPVTRYADEHGLNVRDRLELFVRICEGVQHAHQKAIIHRDLKPSNILVVEVDGKPQPRIIDFGIAKAVSGGASADQTMLTEAGALMGTPGFMSPEQGDPAVADVDTRTDVYSLGVVLYVLLTGMLPFEGRERAPVHEMLRRVREDDPPSPSSKVQKEKSTALEAAGKRGTEAKQLARALKGDLDWIALKALEKDRNRRYGTPSELAADIQRYLGNLPVVARPASAGYRFKKYVQRHRVGVGAAAALAAVLVAFAVTEAVQLRKTIREKDRADRIAEFMTGIFRVADPGESKGNSVTAREILDKASAEVETGLRKDPELQAKLMSHMADAYVNLGLLPAAGRLVGRSIETRRKLAGPRDPESLRMSSQLAFILWRQGKFSEAENLLRETILSAKATVGTKNLLTISSLRYLALVLEFQGRYAEAHQIQQESLDAARALFGPEHFETLLGMNVMANILGDEGKLAEAEVLYRQTAAVQRKTLGAEHPDTMTSMSNLAAVVEEQGRYAEAESMQRETLALRRRVLGPEHPDTMALMHNLANTLHASGRLDEAEGMFRETLDIQKRVVGTEHPDTMSTIYNLAGTLHDQKREDEANALFTSALDGRRRVLGPEHPDTIKIEMEFAGILGRQKKHGQARKLYEELVSVARKSQDRQMLAGLFYDLACSAAISGEREESMGHLQHAIENGYSNADHMLKDDDLKSLRGEARFADLAREARKGQAPPEAP